MECCKTNFQKSVGIINRPVSLVTLAMSYFSEQLAGLRGTRAVLSGLCVRSSGIGPIPAPIPHDRVKEMLTAPANSPANAYSTC